MKILICILVTSLLSWAQDGRLDPHGDAGQNIKDLRLREHKSCTVCHLESGKLKPQSESSCMNCHNKAPHSGVAEHLGKTWNSEKISCMSCHSPHRFASKVAENGDFFRNNLIKPLKEDFEFKSKPKAMLKRTCVECHKW